MRSTETVCELRKKKNKRSGERETARSFHEINIYRLKNLQQRMRHIFQILVGFSQLLMRRSHEGGHELKVMSHNNLLMKTKHGEYIQKCLPRRLPRFCYSQQDGMTCIYPGLGINQELLC